MVEPLEDTRSELIFATEPLLSSLALSIPGASRTPPVELDEIEVSRLVDCANPGLTCCGMTLL
jgi:SCY1-like protein 2